MRSKYCVFGVDSDTTVLRDKPIPAFIKKEAKIVLDAVINAHSAYQIVIQANEEINEYSISTSSLHTEKNDEIAERFVDVYNCKYTLVKTNVERFYNLGEGYYPNAILPMEKAVEYCENKIKKGDNQSIYFSFNIPKNTNPGIYTGSFSLFIDGEEVVIPVEVNVRAVSIPEESHLRTLVPVEWDWHGPSTEREFVKYQRYTNLLTKYRLNVSTLIPYPRDEELQKLYGGRADTLEQLYDFHADLAYEYCLNPLNTTFSIPYKSWVKKREVEGGIQGTQSEYLMGLECDVFEGFLSALIRKSLETKLDLAKRGIIYFGRFIDEPQGQGTMDRLDRTNQEYHEILDRLSQELQVNQEAYICKYDISKDFIEKLAASVKNMPHIITTHYDAKYDAYIDTYCPHFWFLQEEDNFAYYAKRKERWWYGCNGPTSPCPSYHLDDHLLSPRILSWLQYKYDYVGNLYWAINCYNFQAPGQHPYFDFYSDPQGSGQVNLDGILAYPGEIYGMEENVATLRMEEIRAGMEDYEMLYALGNAYNNKGHSLKQTFEYYMNFMSRGIKIIGSTEIFSNIRKLFLDLYELHYSTGLCVCDLHEEEGKLKGKIYIDEPYTLSCGGVCLKPLCENGCAVYEFSISNETSGFMISGNNLQRNLDLTVGKRSIIASKTLLNGMSDEKFGMQFIDNGQDGVQLIIPTEKGLVQTVKLAIPQDVDLENAVAILLHFNNQKEEKKFEGFNICTKFEHEPELRAMLSIDTYLPPLKSSMPVYLSNNDWGKTGRLEYLLISFGEDNEEYQLLSETTPIKRYIHLLSAEVIYKK